MNRATLGLRQVGFLNPATCPSSSPRRCALLTGTIRLRGANRPGNPHRDVPSSDRRYKGDVVCGALSPLRSSEATFPTIGTSRKSL